jgi:hypothetical protein
LENAGFESGTEKGPAGWSKGPRLDGVKYLWDHEVKHSGSASLSILKSADRYFPIAEWTQSTPVPAGAKTVEISAWMKTAQAYKAILDVQFASLDGVSSHHWIAYDGAKEDNDAPSNHDWKLAGGSAPIPPGTVEVIVALQDYGPGQVWFDDVRVRFTKDPPEAK